MKKVINFMLALGALHAPYVYSSNEEDVKIKIEQAQNAINEDNETFNIKPRSVSDWPSRHPASAVFANFERFRDSFDFYIWQENNNVWVEVLPVTTAPFVCSSSFDIIQNGIQFDTVKLENITGNSQCGDVLVSSAVYKLTQWSFYSTKADLNSPFTLIFNSEQFLDFSSSGISVPDTPLPIDPESECSHANFNNGVLYIPRVDVINDFGGSSSYEVEMTLTLPSPLTFKVTEANLK